MPISLTRSVTFRAMHRLADAARSEADNRAAWGALAEPHTHHYTCRVTVSGRPRPGTGMVIDLGELDRILTEEVTRRFEGQDLNAELPAVRAGTALPVCETIALELFTRIGTRLPDGAVLDRVVVEEDPTLSAECSR